MTTVLTLLLINAVLGAWDTLWYHEYKTQLATNLETTRTELRLHAARDFVYVGIYGLLAWLQPTGAMVWLLAAGLIAEIVITLADFVVEDRDRPALGGMAAGERILHTLMAIGYGAMLAFLIPELRAAVAQPTGFVAHGAPAWASLATTATALGIAVSGARDALALRGVDVLGWLAENEPVQEARRIGEFSRSGSSALLTVPLKVPAPVSDWTPALVADWT